MQQVGREERAHERPPDVRVEQGAPRRETHRSERGPARSVSLDEDVVRRRELAQEPVARGLAVVPGQVGKGAQKWLGQGSLSMTSAGIASTYVASEYTVLSEGDGVPKVGRDPFPEPVQRALLGLEQGDLAVNIPQGQWWGYNLYGIERVGLASGLKYLGAHDWYRELARKVIDRQMANGSWKGSLIDTAYAVIFLSRGRHPVLVNKLRLDRLDHIRPDHWHNRPRDAAFLTRYASQQLERPLNWQIVPLSRGFTEWMDSPVLYIASHRRPMLHPHDYENLRPVSYTHLTLPTILRV